LLLIAFFDFIGNYVRRGYAGMLSLWVQHTLLQMCPVPLAVFTYYIAGIAVMLWMSPAMTLIVVCVLVCLAITALRARRRVFAQT
ncbi:hypothetical protein NL347_28290, partial [Klebsiella pneumoniae]|nr:hypothetical protein [Klebsiella pneumoniae]